MIPGPLELIVILLIVLVLFGAGRIPGIAENLAKGIKSFKHGLKDEDAALPVKKLPEAKPVAKAAVKKPAVKKAPAKKPAAKKVAANKTVVKKSAAKKTAAKKPAAKKTTKKKPVKK